LIFLNLLTLIKDDPKDEMESNHFQFIWAGNLKFDVCKFNNEHDLVFSK